MSNIYVVRTDASGLVYRVSNLENLKWDVESPVSPMALPEESHEESILVKMEGNSAKMDISWTLTQGDNFGTLSIVSGKYVFTGGGDLTIFEQLGKFKDEFVPKSIGDGFKILMTEDDGTEVMTDYGTVSAMSFSVSGDSPVVWQAHLSFYVGTVIALLEADIPERPDSVIFSHPSAGTITISYVAFSGYASTPPALTGYKVKIKKDNAPWEVIEGSLSATSGNVSITSLAAGTYRVTFGLKNANSEDAATVYMSTAKTSLGSKSLVVTV